MSTKSARTAAFKAAQSILDEAKAEGRELTADEAAAVEELIKQIKELDAQIEKLSDIFGSGSSAESTEKHFGPGSGSKSLGRVNHVTGQHETEAQRTGRGFLDVSAKNLHAIADRAARGMVVDSGFGQKALLPAGQTAVTVPMASTVNSSARPMSELLALLPTVTQSSPVFRYLRQTARTNNAAVVAPGALKPTSEYGLTPVEGQLQVVAHLSEGIDKYALGDVANLQQFIADELLYGLHRALENQVLNGTGAGQLTGILATSGIQTQAFATDLLTTTRQAVTKIENAGYTPSAFALSPADWEALELARTDTAGTLELGGPVDRAARKLWGVPIAICNALPAKTAVLLDSSAVALDTDGRLDVQWSEAVGDDFAKNLLRARCESRYHVSVYQPLGVVKLATATA